MLFILSGAFLGAMFYWAFYKRDVPGFLRKFFISQSYLYDAKDGDERKAASPKMALYKVFLSILIVASTYLFLEHWYPYEPGYITVKLVVSAVMLTIGFNAFGESAFVKVAKGNIKTKKEEQIRIAYDAKSMATIADLERVTSDRGFYIGGPYWHWFGDGHILTVSDTGGGKNAGIIIPGFISPAFTATQTSIFATDPKGESYFVCRDELIRQGYKVYRINPTDIFGMGSNNFNLFDMIQADSRDVVSFCRTIAAALSPVSGNSETSDHFSSKAQTLLTFYMLYMLHKLGPGASFVALCDWIMKSGKERMAFLEEMSKSDCYQGIVASMAGAIISGAELGGDREVSGIYSSAEKALISFMDLETRTIAQRSDFSLQDLIDHPTAVFINIPFDDLEKSAGWIRAMIAVLNRIMEQRTNRARRLLISLDEFVQLGHVTAVEKGFVTLRSFGVTYHIVVQDFSQLKAVYPKSYKSFNSSAAIRHILDVRDWDTCKQLSEITGKDVATLDQGADRAPQVIQKPVVSPDAFYHNDKYHYLFVKGMPNVIRLEKAYYFRNPHFNGRWAQNPLHHA